MQSVLSRVVPPAYGSGPIWIVPSGLPGTVPHRSSRFSVSVRYPWLPAKKARPVESI